MMPQNVNAYYNPGINEICFPAGILQPPFFDADAEPAENYGGIGAVIGHEIGHGFDDQGSQYDGAATSRTGGPTTTAAAFQERADKLIAQYDGFEPGRAARRARQRRAHRRREHRRPRRPHHRAEGLR